MTKNKLMNIARAAILANHHTTKQKEFDAYKELQAKLSKLVASPHDVGDAVLPALEKALKALQDSVFYGPNEMIGSNVAIGKKTSKGILTTPDIERVINAAMKTRLVTSLTIPKIKTHPRVSGWVLSLPVDSEYEGGVVTTYNVLPKTPVSESTFRMAVSKEINKYYSQYLSGENQFGVPWVDLYVASVPNFYSMISKRFIVAVDTNVMAMDNEFIFKSLPIVEMMKDKMDVVDLALSTGVDNCGLTMSHYVQLVKALNFMVTFE